MSQNSDFSVGQTINGRYTILSMLGSGCMGAVYKVEDLQLGSTVVALKLLSPNFRMQPEEIERFRREVVLLRKVIHPNVVSVYQFGTTESGRHFYTMEYVEGQSLYSLIYGQYDCILKTDELVCILLDIVEGLLAIHRVGVVHCDLKPENIMIAPEGRVKLTDFGLSSDVQSSRHGHQPGIAVGTPFYMSPEQFQGDAIDHRADIYALGLIAYEMAARVKPFYHADYFDLAEMHFNQPIPDVHHDRRDVPQWYGEFIQHCTRKNREDRFQSAEEMLQYLRRQVAHRKEFKRKRAGRKTTFFDSRSFKQQLDKSDKRGRSTEVVSQQVRGLNVLADAHYLLGSEYLAKARFDAAREHLEIASQLDPFNADALIARAALAEKDNNLEHAVRLYRKVLQRDSHAESAYLALGMLYYKLGDRRAALLHLGTFVGMARGQKRFESDYGNAETIVRQLEESWSG